MERSAQFRDGERVDSSTATAERLDAVKRSRLRSRRAETTAARRAAKCERERRRRSCEARLWLVFLIASLHCFFPLLFGFLLGTCTTVLTTSTAHTCTYTAVRYVSYRLQHVYS